MSPLVRPAVLGLHVYLNMVGLGLEGGLTALLRWFSAQGSRCSALWVLVVQQRVGWPVAPGMPQSKSQHSVGHFALPLCPHLSSWLIGNHREHKSSLI